MNRKQLYEEIKNLNLQEEVKAAYGDNYTRCTNEQLECIVKKAHEALNPNCSFEKLVNILAKKNILLKSEVKEIMKF